MKQKKWIRSTLVFSFEQKFLSFIGDHLYLIAIILLTALGLLVRYDLKDFMSLDAWNFLLPWYDVIKPQGFAALSQQVGDYNILYQFLVAIFTYLPMEALHAYKLFSVIFDFLLAALGAWIILKNSDTHAQLKSVLMYAAILFSPLVLFNSAVWAQCDAIYTYFCIFSLYEMYKEKPLASVILFGVALTFKLQAIFILPILLFIYFRRRSFSILYFLAVPVVMIVLSIPGFINGRSISDVFDIYVKQTSNYKLMVLNYPSFWALFQDTKLDEASKYQMFSKAAVILTLVILLAYFLIWYKKKVALSYDNLFVMSFIVVYTCILFLPSMHERYGYMYEILALFVAFRYRKTIPLLVGTYCLSLLIYGRFLFDFVRDLSTLAFINLLVYALYVLYLNCQLLKGTGSDTDEQPLKLKRANGANNKEAKA